MTLYGYARIGLILCCSMLLKAQEITHIDLSLISQRTELRHPPAPPSNCEPDKGCVGGGYSSVGVADGAPDWRDPHALGIYLLSAYPTEINAAEPFEVEFKVLNTGLAPIELPVSRHLSDLQPYDASVPFTYLSVALIVRTQGDVERLGVPVIGFVELYGMPDREGSTVMLRPGEWIRVKARIKLQRPVAGMAQLHGEFWLRKNTFRPHAGGGSSTIVNLYPNATPTPPVTVHFLPRSSQQQP